MNYAEAISYLNGLSRFGWQLGLERIEALCERLGFPERAFDSVHVAGTNGKGSTATFLARSLQAAGYRTGLYTSPHLYTGRERIQVDGENISEERVCELMALAAPQIESVNRDIGPVTEFEAWTAVMFLHFQRCGVKVAVIEAGLGGRWDSTNVIQPRLAVLTNVSLDHTDRLGKTVAEITRDKAGIIKTGGRVLTGPLPPEARSEVLVEVKRNSARLSSLLPMGEPLIPDRAGEINEDVYHWEAADEQAIRLSVLGDGSEVIGFSGARYQAANAALAATAAFVLQEEGYRVPLRDMETGLKTQVPGRFERVNESPEVILDGAHNPAAARVLADELLRPRLPRGNAPGGGGGSPTGALRLVFGGSEGHDAETCLRILAPIAAEVILTRSQNPRSRNPEELARALEGFPVPWEIIESVPAAVGTAVRRSRPYDRVCVTGSFFVLGESPRSFH